ncbi:hypothetical protein BC832DRAFT_591042 [Gaertneriomyces semiglobifer]|nr:hypothetical protein BC832DRAFT_591042 [Gaertneriomyces semiglobifer]
MSRDKRVDARAISLNDKSTKMDMAQLERHIRGTTVQHREELNLSNDDIEDTIKRLLIVLYDIYNNDDNARRSSPNTRSLRKAMFAAVQEWDFTHSARRVIDLCFPAQRGILGAPVGRNFVAISKHNEHAPVSTEMSPGASSSRRPPPYTDIERSGASAALDPAEDPEATERESERTHSDVRVPEQQLKGIIRVHRAVLELLGFLLESHLNLADLIKSAANNAIIWWCRQNSTSPSCFPWESSEPRYHVLPKQGVLIEMVLNEAGAAFISKDSASTWELCRRGLSPQFSVTVTDDILPEMRPSDVTHFAGWIHFFAGTDQPTKFNHLALCREVLIGLAGPVTTFSSPITTSRTALLPFIDSIRRTSPDSVSRGLVLCGPDSVGDEEDRVEMARALCDELGILVLSTLRWVPEYATTAREIAVDCIQRARLMPWQPCVIIIRLASQASAMMHSRAVLSFLEILSECPNMFVVACMEAYTSSALLRDLRRQRIRPCYISRPSFEERNHILCQMLQRFRTDVELLTAPQRKLLLEGSTNFARSSFRGCLHSVLHELQYHKAPLAIERITDQLVQQRMSDDIAFSYPTSGNAFREDFYAQWWSTIESSSHDVIPSGPLWDTNTASILMVYSEYQTASVDAVLRSVMAEKQKLSFVAVFDEVAGAHVQRQDTKARSGTWKSETYPVNNC